MVNFGVVKNRVSRNLSEHYISFSNKKAEEDYRDFIQTVKESPILMLEYIVFKNLEKSNLQERDAMKYIDDNMSLFKNYDRKDIIAENKKLERFLSESESADKLTASIQALILESASKSKLPNINKMFDSFSLIMESMTKEGEETCLECKETEEAEEYSLNEIVAAANKNISDKLGELDEDEQKIVSTLYSDNEIAKEVMLESYKSKALELLKNEAPSEMIDEVYSKVANMTYKNDTVLDNILALYELIS